MLGLPRYPVPYDDFSKKGFVPPGWDERGIPWVVEVPWLGLTFTNGFMYGLVSRRAFSCPSATHATTSNSLLVGAEAGILTLKRGLGRSLADPFCN